MRFWVVSRVSRVRDLVRESSRNLLEELEDPSDLLERPTGKNSTVIGLLNPKRELIGDRHCVFLELYAKNT